MSDAAHAPAAAAGGKSGFTSLAVGLLALSAAAMIGMIFFGVGLEGFAQSMGKAAQYLNQMGSSIARFYQLNQVIINLAIAFAALIGVAFLAKKLLG